MGPVDACSWALTLSTQVLNRFSSDIFEVDFSLPNAILNVSRYVSAHYLSSTRFTYIDSPSLFISVLGSILLICISAPWVSLVVLG